MQINKIDLYSYRKIIQINIFIYLNADAVTGVGMGTSDLHNNMLFLTKDHDKCHK